MSTARMLRYTGRDLWRHGCLALNGDTEPFVAAGLAGPRIDRRATMSAASADAEVKPNTLARRRDTVASLPRRHTWSVAGPAGKAEDASDASPTSPKSLTWAYAPLRRLSSYLTAFPSGLT